MYIVISKSEPCMRTMIGNKEILIPGDFDNPIATFLTKKEAEKAIKETFDILGPVLGHLSAMFDKESWFAAPLAANE